MDSEKLKDTHFATRCVHGFGGPDPATGAISVPIYQTSTFAFEDVPKETVVLPHAGKRIYYRARWDRRAENTDGVPSRALCVRIFKHDIRGFHEG